jgi:hypothetical protein
MTESPSYLVESKSHTAEELSKVLGGQGFATVQVETITNEPAPVEPAIQPAPAAEPVAVTPPPVVEPPAPAAPPAPTELTESQKRRAAQKAKFKKLEADLAEERRLRERYERDLTEARATKPVTPPPAPAPDPVFEPKAEPKWEDFASAEDQVAAFSKAITKHTLDEYNRERDFKASIEERKRKESESVNRAAQEARIARWNEKNKVAAEAIPDYKQVWDESAAKTKTSPLMDLELDLDPEGWKVAYWLMKHPEESARIADATAYDPKTPLDKDKAESQQRLIIREFGKIHARITQEAPPAVVVESPTNEEDEIDDAETFDAPVVAAAPPPQALPPVGRVIPPAGTPAPPAPQAAPPAPLPKPESMPRHVGSRAASHVKSLAELQPDQVRAMTPDEYRKMRGM